MTATSFSSLALSPAMLSNLESLGYREMTPIQAQSLPVILELRDLIAPVSYTHLTLPTIYSV